MQSTGIKSSSNKGASKSRGIIFAVIPSASKRQEGGEGGEKKNSKTRRGEKKPKGGGDGGRKEKKGRRKCVFHPHDTTTGGLLDFSPRCRAPVSQD